jgi:hypothetical protein
MTDRLSLTNALADADIDRQKAERIATEIFDAINQRVATKADVSAVQADIATVRADLRELEQRVELRFEKVEHKIDTMVNRIVAAMAAAVAVLFGALHYWPPHS